MVNYKPRTVSTHKKASGRAGRCTNEEKSAIVYLYRALGSYEDVARRTGRSPNCVKYIVLHSEDLLCNTPKKPIGRPRVTSSRDDQILIREMKKNRDVTSQQLLEENPQIKCSRQTVRRRITESGEFASYWKIKKPFINKINRNKRKAWCKAHLAWTKEDWAKVLWSDESPFVLRFNRKTRVWRRHNERYEIFATRATVKHDVKINVWGCFSALGVGDLHLIDGIMDKHQYKSILENQMLPSVRRLYRGENYIFQQDNDPKHTAKTTKTWMRRNNIPLMDWPSQSPDLNPLENLWSYLDYKCKNRKPASKEELYQCLLEQWRAIPNDLLMKLSDSMPDRINAVLKAKGYATKY